VARVRGTLSRRRCAEGGARFWRGASAAYELADLAFKHNVGGGRKRGRNVLRRGSGGGGEKGVAAAIGVGPGAGPGTVTGVWGRTLAR